LEITQLNTGSGGGEEGNTPLHRGAIDRGGRNESRGAGGPQALGMPRNTEKYRPAGLVACDSLHATSSARPGDAPPRHAQAQISQRVKETRWARVLPCNTSTHGRLACGRGLGRGSRGRLALDCSRERAGEDHFTRQPFLNALKPFYPCHPLRCQEQTPPLMSHFAEIRAIILFSYCTQLPTSLECGGVEYRHDRG